MKASLIIAVYKNVAYLKSVLDSLKYQTVNDFEVIIAEDGDSKGMQEFIASYPFLHPFQHITQPDEGWRKNKILNQAIRASKSNWLIFIDGDCVLHPRFIEMHLRYAGENVILAGKRVKLDQEFTDVLLDNIDQVQYISKKLVRKLLIGKKKLRHPEEGIFLDPKSFWGFIPKLRHLDNLKGCNMSFAKEAICSINGFDEDYILPAIGEDFDITWRLAAAGYRYKSVRNLAVQYHLHHPENWADTTENMKICNANKAINKFVCSNGLEKR
jgi:GT2 family glycosyltransferase